jgi:23S rRNA (uridine2552-2'-O)-methyltransferase
MPWSLSRWTAKLNCYTAVGVRRLWLKMFRASQFRAGSGRSRAGAFVARQANDPFVNQARRDGYVCRSAYKLIEVDDKLHLLRDVRTAVIDLGSSPGGWSQVIRRRVQPHIDVYGVDLLVMQARLPGVKFIQGDFSSLDVQRSLRAELDQRSLTGRIDVVVSDMCPNRRGDGDRHVSAKLNENAIRFAVLNLRLGGHFVCKVLGSDDHFQSVVELARANITRDHRVRPAATRSESDESFLVGYGKLAEPKPVSRMTTGGIACSPGILRAEGLRARPVSGAFGLDDWPGGRRR